MKYGLLMVLGMLVVLVVSGCVSDDNSSIDSTCLDNNEDAVLELNIDDTKIVDGVFIFEISIKNTGNNNAKNVEITCIAPDVKNLRARGTGLINKIPCQSNSYLEIEAEGSFFENELFPQCFISNCDNCVVTINTEDLSRILSTPIDSYW